MSLTTASPKPGRPRWSRITHSAWATSLSRAWQWLTLVRADDPVRAVLNRGFASVIIVVIPLNAILGPALLRSGETAAALVSLISIPLYIFLWWLNRRGMVYGATLFVIWAAVGLTLGSTPSSYAGANAPIPLIFVFPMIIATLFISPWAGLWALLLQMTLLGLQLAFSDVPQEDALRFMIVGTLNLAGVMAFLIVGATIFSRALRSSIASNQALQQLNVELEQRVADRTAALEHANHALLDAKDAADHARAAAEDANRYKSHFLANMSHELRTPLNAILNFAHFLGDMEYGSVTEQQKMFQSRILYNGEHLLGLINDILDLSKIEAGKAELLCETADLHPLLHGVMATAVGLTKDKGLALDLEADDELPPVWIDTTRIRQVLLNLLSNAAKFTDQGTITVRAHASGDGFVQISVQDTGIGIAPEHQARVFEEFQQVQDDFDRVHQGTGLGLPISKRLVEMHGGRMWLESTPGLGSAFTFTLPVAAAALSGAAAQPLITVIDDDVDSQRILHTMLEGAGYQVRSMLDSQGALDELRRAPPALIVLDLKMAPLDGWDLLCQIDQDPQLATIPVVICSVLDPAQEQVGVLTNVLAYLQKPVRQEELLAVARQVALPGPVLVVDDDPDARQVLKGLLERLGHTVVEAASGAAALALIPELRPNLVLLDLLMPEVDGFAVLEALQELPAAAQVPVVVVTAKELDAAEQAWLRERTHHCFQKPVPAPMFLNVVRNVLKGVAHAHPAARTEHPAE